MINDDDDVVYLGEVKYSEGAGGGRGEEDSSGEENSVEDDEEEIMTPLQMYRNSYQAAFGHIPNAENTVHQFQLIPLQSSNREYLFVCEKMMMNISILPQPFTSVAITMQFDKYEIIKIEKVWNTNLLSRYTQHVQRIKEENNNELNESLLFHGSQKCLEIVEKGFDERYASNNGIFGAGVYFAEHSSKGNYYTGTCNLVSCLTCPRRMLLCRVALGNMYDCIDGADKFAHAPPGHHSVKGFVATGNMIFPEYVIYRGEQAYPEYLITYRSAY